MDFTSFLPSSMDQDHRRLSNGPGFVDFVVIVGLGIILFYLLKVLKDISAKWKAMMKARITKAMEIRAQSKDTFRNTNGYSWDYVMVFAITPAANKLSPIQEEHNVKYILQHLADAGLQTKCFYSIQNDELYVKIRAPYGRLQREADRVNYRLRMEPAQLANCLRMGGGPEKPWKGIEVPTVSRETTISPYDYIYVDFQHELHEKDLFFKHPNSSIFRSVDRLKLIATIIAARQNDGGADLDVYRLIKNKCMLTFFPLHDAVELRELEDKWLRMCQVPWHMKLDPVKDYFGEKIGIFFLFLQHYTTFLLPAAIIGAFAWINVVDDDNNPSAPVIPFFAAFVAIWSTYMLEYWKRTEKMTAMKWGMVGTEADEQSRPEFSGIPSVHAVTGQPIRYFPRNAFLFRVFLSTNVISVLICVVIAVIASIFFLRIVLSRMQALVVGGIQTGSIITALINAVQIQIMNMIYNTIAIRLTDFENHRTNTEYEDSLIGKTFVFQFINSFSSLFYIAFIKPYIPDLDPCVGSCMAELQSSLGTIFLTRLALGNTLKVLIPVITQRGKTAKESKGGSVDELSEVERAFILDEYHVMLGPFADYANLIIQYGYATMFISAYPLAMMMSFISNYVEIRIDAWKLCQLCRRPEPRSGEDLGTWYPILEIVGVFCVLCNSALVAFTGNNTEDFPWVSRVWIFFGMSAGLMAFKAYVAYSIPDIPEEVAIQLARNKFFKSKIVDNVPDDDGEGLVNKNAMNNSYVIRINDDDPL